MEQLNVHFRVIFLYHANWRNGRCDRLPSFRGHLIVIRKIWLIATISLSWCIFDAVICINHLLQFIKWAFFIGISLNQSKLRRDLSTTHFNNLRIDSPVHHNCSTSCHGNAYKFRICFAQLWMNKRIVATQRAAQFTQMAHLTPIDFAFWN